MNIKKILIHSILPLLCAVTLFAEDGLMAGQKNIKCVSTQWFDIIYSETSEESAAELAASADKIYTDICADMGTTPQFRMPVVITSSTDAYNAYYTNYAYNHLVLLDAVPQEELAVNGTVIVDTFKHELTHAVTINMRNKFWKGFDSVFGDLMNWGDYVVMPSMIKEGAAVAYESKSGAGRLNDEYYLQFIKQSKIENKFPSWADVTGAMDVYPSGNSAYAYGGPFTAWLQNKYGMEKYSDFWYRAINMKAITFAYAFNKAYGFSISKAWNEFAASIEVPDVNANPLAVDGINDFFSFGENDAEEKDFSIQNKRGSLYTNLTESDIGIAYIDDGSNGVFFARKNDDGTFSSARKLFSKPNVSRISFSRDGKFLAVSYYDINHMNVKNRVALYEIDGGRWFTVNETGLRDATVVCMNVAKPDGGTETEYFLAAVKTLSQNVSLAVYEIKMNDKNRATDISLANKVDFARGDVLFSLCDADGGDIACVYKNGMTWSIKIFTELCKHDSAGGMSVKTYSLPKQDMRIRNISLVSDYDEVLTFAFSWTAPSTMPRLGYLMVTHDESTDYYALMSQDISGGVYYPVAYRCADSNRGQYPSVAYSGFFSTDKKILVMNSAKIMFDEVQALSETTTADTASTNVAVEKASSRQILAGAKKYSKWYWNKGSLLPYSVVPQYNQFINQKTDFMFPGITWITNNPWDADFVSVSAGFDPLSLTGGALVEFSGGSTTSLFSYDVIQTMTADELGFKQTVSYGSVQSGLRVGNHSSIAFLEQAFVFIGRPQLYSYKQAFETDYSQNPGKLFGCIQNTGLRKYFSAVNQAGIQFSNVHACGPNSYEDLGCTVTVYYQNIYAGGLLGEWSRDYYYQNLYPTFSFRLPCLIPINCVQGMTYNLPLSAKVALVPNSTQLIAGSSEVILFSREIQKGLTFFPLFFNRITTTAGYDMYIDHSNRSFEIARVADDFNNCNAEEIVQYVHAKVVFDVTGNTGSLAQSGLFARIGAECDYFLTGSMAGSWSFGATYSLLF